MARGSVSPLSTLARICVLAGQSEMEPYTETKGMLNNSAYHLAIGLTIERRLQKAGHHLNSFAEFSLMSMPTMSRKCGQMVEELLQEHV